MVESMDRKVLNKERFDQSRWDWILRIFIQPKRILDHLSEIDRRAWFKPMLVLTVLVVLLSILGGEARLRAVQMNVVQPPEDFQYWSEEQQNQFFESQAATQGPLFIYVFPLLGAIAGLWAGWFLLGSMLHLLLTLKGSRQSQVAYLNLVAWAALPFAIRSLVQLVAVISTQRLVSAPGLSGFIDAGEQSALIYLRLFLSLIDIYSIWFLGLLLTGAPLVSRIKSKKALSMTLLALIFFVILASLPAFVSNQLGGLGTIRPFLIF